MATTIKKASGRQMNVTGASEPLPPVLPPELIRLCTTQDFLRYYYQERILRSSLKPSGAFHQLFAWAGVAPNDGNPPSHRSRTIENHSQEVPGLPPDSESRRFLEIGRASCRERV